MRGFDLDETVAYVDSRLARAGLKDQTVIPPQLLEEIHYRAQGIPRVINAICDNLLLTAFAMESRIATVAMLDEVAADMRLEYPVQHPFRAETVHSERTLRRSVP